MNTQEKIKELIEKYKNLCVLRTFSNPSDVINDLESLLEPECEHLETVWKESTKSTYSGYIDQYCADCHEYLVTARKSL